MNKIFILSFFFSIAISFQLSAVDISQDTLAVENEYLRSRVSKLVGDAEDAFIADKVDSSFSNALIRQLTRIADEADFRESVLQKLSKPVRRRSGEAMPNSNSILRTMQYEMDMAFLYCDASERVLGMVDAFSANKKAYFAPGKYLIPYKIRKIAKQVYSPIIDSMASLVNEFPELSFKSMIRTTGYSDASPTPKGSLLYNDMVQRMQYEPLKKEEINMYLSYLRSYDLSAILKEMTKDEASLKAVRFNFDRAGKGTELPNLNENYSIKDERRRAVHVYWHILPKF